MSGSVPVLAYNGTTDEADPGYSTNVANLNLFYEVRALVMMIRNDRSGKNLENSLADMYPNE